MCNGIDKLEIADEMMESAIECYFDNERYFAALNLAGVSQEIYGKWIRVNGGKDYPSQAIDMIEKLENRYGESGFNRKEMKKFGNHAKNTIKHMDNESDRYANLEPRFDSFLQLMEAYVEHKRLGRPHTDNIERLVLYARSTRENGSLQ